MPKTARDVTWEQLDDLLNYNVNYEAKTLGDFVHTIECMVKNSPDNIDASNCICGLSALLGENANG